jgi:hypothetical protein
LKEKLAVVDVWHDISLEHDCILESKVGASFEPFVLQVLPKLVS